jgi:hypothetical protein
MAPSSVEFFLRRFAAYPDRAIGKVSQLARVTRGKTAAPVSKLPHRRFPLRSASQPGGWRLKSSRFNKPGCLFLRCRTSQFQMIERAPVLFGWAALAFFAEEQGTKVGFAGFLILFGWGQVFQVFFNHRGSNSVFEEAQDFHRFDEGLGLGLDYVIDSDQPRGFYFLTRNLYHSAPARVGSQSSGPVNPHGPQPFVDPHVRAGFHASVGHDSLGFPPIRTLAGASTSAKSFSGT